MSHSTSCGWSGPASQPDPSHPIAVAVTLVTFPSKNVTEQVWSLAADVTIVSLCHLVSITPTALMQDETVVAMNPFLSSIQLVPLVSFLLS